MRNDGRYKICAAANMQFGVLPHPCVDLINKTLLVVQERYDGGMT